MFRKVAPRYDFLNSLLSFGQDAQWRRVFTLEILKGGARNIIDVATGSGDVALALCKQDKTFSNLSATPLKIVGYDFCEELLIQARAKALAQGIAESTLSFRSGDALDLGLPELSVDAITVSFGLRNFSDRKVFYAQARKLLKPNGSLFILEFSQPHALLKPFYALYQKIIPSLASLFGSPAEAYAYLNKSINAFPSAPALAQELSENGFKSITFNRLTGGVVAIHRAVN